MPADHLDRQSGGKTMRAASGSTQMLYSAAGVTLPSQHGAPPMTTQRPILFASPGSRASASATLVSGPRVTSVRPGDAPAKRRIASTACSRSGAGAAQGSHDRRGRRGHETSARVHAAHQRRSRADKDRMSTPRSRQSAARSRRLFDADVAGDYRQSVARDVRGRKRHEMATASSEAVSVSMRKSRMGSNVCRRWRQRGEGRASSA